VVGQIEAALRSTDLLAAGEGGGYYALLPQTDSLGAGVLAQRIRRSLEDGGHGELVSGTQIACATFPADGTQLDALLDVLGSRIEQRRSSLVAEKPEFARPQPLDTLFDRMLELASIESAGIEGQILRFVLEDTARRPADRGVLFVSPGARWLPEILATLDEIRGRPSRTEIVLIAEGEDTAVHPNLTRVAKSSLDHRRPFLVYFGDGPSFAMIGQVTLVAEKTPIFQTGDRALVEHLAFELQRELEIQVTV
jgi:hypothetical protein